MLSWRSSSSQSPRPSPQALPPWSPWLSFPNAVLCWHIDTFASVILMLLAHIFLFPHFFNSPWKCLFQCFLLHCIFFLECAPSLFAVVVIIVIHQVRLMARPLGIRWKCNRDAKLVIPLYFTSCVAASSIEFILITLPLLFPLLYLNLLASKGSRNSILNTF